MTCTVQTGIGRHLPLLGSLLILGAGTASVRADALDRALVKEAPKVIKALQEKQYQTVGVLKFRVQRSGQAPTFNAGPINANMADRLQNALVAANDPIAPINIIKDADRTAYKQARSMKKTEVKGFLNSLPGRRSLLANRYELAWDSEPVRPDALLTGDIILSRDNRTATVRIKAFARKTPQKMEMIHEFQVKTDRSILAECGKTFMVRRSTITSDEEQGNNAAANSATDVDQKKNVSNKNVSNSNDSPVELTILYNGNPIELGSSALNGGVVRFQVPDPKETDQVVFRIQRRVDYPVGVVLAVNGKNTLFQEELSDRQPAECTKWVLDNDAPYEINGFYMGETGENLNVFRVLSDADSDAMMELNPDTYGIISMYVFAKNATVSNNANKTGDNAIKGDIEDSKGGKDDPQKITGNNLRSTVLKQIKTKPRSVQEAKRAYTAALNKSRKRGVVEASEVATAGGTLQRVPVDFDPEPIASMQVSYYQRKGTNANTNPSNNPGNPGNPGTNPGNPSNPGNPGNASDPPIPNNNIRNLRRP